MKGGTYGDWTVPFSTEALSPTVSSPLQESGPGLDPAWSWCYLDDRSWRGREWPRIWLAGTGYANNNPAGVDVGAADDAPGDGAADDAPGAGAADDTPARSLAQHVAPAAAAAYARATRPGRGDGWQLHGSLLHTSSLRPNEVSW